MQLKFMKTIMPQQDGAAKITAMAWSQGNTKLAVCNAERVVVLFDENGEKKDKFATKPVDSKYGKKSYSVKGLAFSPDSTKIAIGQTDAILFVYKIGEGWNEKKVICNKFVQQSAVTCLIWPSDAGIVFGLTDGKVRLANIKTNKSSTIYNTANFVVSLAASPDARGFLSGHVDGSVVRYYFDEKSSGVPNGKICTHTVPPYALAWTVNTVVCAGADKRIISYSKDGKLLQQFDYSREADEKEFTCSAASPSGQSVVVGSFDRFRVFDWASRKGAWEEGKVKEIKYLYTITAMAWKYDGSRLVAGTLCGSVEMFDCSLKRSVLNNKFEVTYVGPGQALVRHMETGQSVQVKSDMGYDIEDIKVKGKDRFVVATTAETLLLADLEKNRCSEVVWKTAGNEKFLFENDNVCMIFNAGELCVVEYGRHDLLGSVRTEFMNPHLISCRINERFTRGAEEVKRLAFLIDWKTISITDLSFGTTIATINHDSKIDWLDLNETGKKLLFRDKRYRLHLFDVETEQKTTLLSFCSYIQWVPGSDVAVAQSRNNMCIWYNIEAPDQFAMIPIKGDIIEISRENNQTEVVVNEGIQHVAYPLDEGLIEFGTAMEDNDFIRAIQFLVILPVNAESEAMWKQLAKASFDQRQLHIAERCYGALNDIARVRFINETRKIAQESAKQIGGDGTQFYKVRARLAIMERQFKEAERIFLEQNSMQEAIEMYQNLHRWDEAIELAEARGHPDVEQLKTKYMRHLAETGQDEKAGELREKEGDHMAAIDLYLKGGMPAKAAKLITENEQLMRNSDLVQTVAVSLIKNELYERAGELFEKVKDFERALECYKRGKAYNRAVDLSRYAFPDKIMELEEEWGDYLSSQKQLSAAIPHYVEARNNVKALEAATKSRQWQRAVEIVEVLDQPDLAKEYYGKIGEHYASVQEFDRAERYLLEAEMIKEVIEMYNKAGKFDEAQRVSMQYMPQDVATEMQVGQAKALEEQGRYREAEKLYISVKQPNLAISMYKNAEQFDQMMRLVEEHYPDRAEDMHLHLAKELDENGNLREAEIHYISGKEWKSAITMYREAGQWEDAYRVAKQHGGDIAPKQVAYLWAKSLGGDSAVKLLQKFGLLDEAIDYASDNRAFEFAFELCRLGMKSKLPHVQQKYALLLQEEGDLTQAERMFIECGRGKDAVLMYIQEHDWDNAQRVAEAHAPEAINDVYIGQARNAFEQRDYAKAEGYLLRAQKPDIIVKSYKELNMWNDALRVCKEYLPALYPKLQDEFDRYSLNTGEGAQAYNVQAKNWLESGDYDRAIECYLKINLNVSQDKALIKDSLIKAGDLAMKFIYPKNGEKGSAYVVEVANNLKSINCYGEAASLLVQVDMAKEAVDAFIEAGEWNKAKKIATDMEPELEDYVDEQYKKSMVDGGDPEQLASVDLVGAVNLYIQRGQWEQALEKAKQNPALLDKYVAMYVAAKIEQSNFQEALDVFVKYGASANVQNFNMYKKLIDEVIALPNTMTAEAYKIWSSMRNMLLSLVENIGKSSEDIDTRFTKVFSQYLEIAHYYALRSAVISDVSLQLLATKASISLLRYSDLIAADKAFYEAGMMCKEAGAEYEPMAFVFLNHYLDLAEAIEDHNPDAVSYDDFEDTDIPSEVPLPEHLYLSEPDHEEVKEWVLAVSVDKQIDRTLRTDQRGVYEACLLAGGNSYGTCVVTGYPVLDSETKIGKLVANKEDWSKLQMTTRMSKNNDCEDVMQFINEWSNSSVAA